MLRSLTLLRVLPFCFLPLFFCGCEKLEMLLGDAPYKYTFTYMTSLDDRSCVQAEITLGFDSQDGVLEASRKRERMAYALDLIVRPYKGEQLTDMGRRMRKILKRVTDNLLETPVERITLTRYEVRFRGENAPSPEELEKMQQKRPRTFHGD